MPDAKRVLNDVSSRVQGLRLSAPSPIGGMTLESPEPRRMIELFGDEWASQLPAPYADVPSGTHPLFDDERIRWAIERLGGVDGSTVLELGPLEGGHTKMLLDAGAGHVLGVEANKRAFLRCLVVKELYGLDRANFLLGDFTSLLETQETHYDIGLAIGVLYHMVDPVRLLSLLARRTDKLVLWTQYFDAAAVARHRTLKDMITESSTATVDGFTHTLHRHDYGKTVRGAGFLGGNKPHSSWLSREDLLGAVEHVGFSGIEIGFDHPDHPNGPALALTATK